MYYKFCSPDLVSMTRKQLGIFGEPVDIEDLSYDEQQDFYLRANELMNDDIFNKIVNNLISEVEQHMLYNATNEQITEDRFTINGVHLVLERIEALSSKIKEQEEQYDKHAVI